MDIIEGPRFLGGFESENDVGNVCPVCNEVSKDLLQLNIHLDVVHGFSEQSSDTGGLNTPIWDGNKAVDQKRSTKKPKFVLQRSHWAKMNKGQSRCSECNVKLHTSTGIINCRHCGQLFCFKHCQNAMRLNEQAAYDIERGEWCRCCRNCSLKKLGRNSFGAVESKTDVFLKLRRSKVEDKQLLLLQLENRFVRLINGITHVNLKHRDSILGSVRKAAEISRLEKSIVPWVPDQFALACSLCFKGFGVTLRKHHCRLCGKVVCDDGATNCSNQIPITNMINAAADLPIRLPPELEISELSTQIRVCSMCSQFLFKNRKFDAELAMPLSTIFQLYERMHGTAAIIISATQSLKEATTEQSYEDAKSPNASDVAKLSRARRRLLDSFAGYDRITKQILNSHARNPTEARIQSSIVSQASLFIQQNMLPLKNLTSHLASQIESSQEPSPEATSNAISGRSSNNLTIQEVKEYRTQLMVLNEQKYLVENMIANATKQRKFEEATTLSKNLEELKLQAGELSNLLGDEGFS
ncbi:LADA_0F11364g1_1 [Lachancea dasiensis]|uniref:LADA_0F11364g1_1 n=1 Tax=Lachancea dasiensis TaxID=1072105 RepID=A0A1G4JMB4_9SACH|nr:LADA_0F11364g1_1 [Lachancea dasiensis]